MNFIVAVSKEFAIGKDNDLLFNLPSDLKYFKEKTIGKVVVMGERTYHSLPFRPLKNRTNIVLSSDPNFMDEGVIIARSLDDLLDILKKYNTDDIFVIGGGSVYNLLMPYCKYAYVTEVDASVKDADTYINNIKTMPNWTLKTLGKKIHENGLTYRFNVYENGDIKGEKNMDRIYNKLVRDGIPNIIRSKGETPVERKLGDEEYKRELDNKLFEEVKEVIGADNRADRLEELADVLEIVRAMANLEGESLDKVIEIANDKAKKRGGFNDRVYLERVIPKD